MDLAPIDNATMDLATMDILNGFHNNWNLNIEHRYNDSQKWISQLWTLHNRLSYIRLRNIKTQQQWT